MAKRPEKPPTDWWVYNSMRNIEETYGDNVDIKGKNLLKFGRNAAVGTSESTIMGLAGSETEETYATTNAIDRLVSDNASETSVVVIEGHNVSGTGEDSEFAFVSQEITLTGQTPVALTTALARATRLYLKGNNGDTLENNAVVYAYESTSSVTSGVPDDDDAVHVILNEADKSNTSLKASTTFSNVDYGVITQVYFGIDKKTAASADFNLKIRTVDCQFRTIFAKPLNSTATTSAYFDIKPHIIVPRNADVIITATASTTNVSCDAGFNALIMKTRNRN